jgi:hypothetical protein
MKKKAKIIPFPNVVDKSLQENAQEEMDSNSMQALHDEIARFLEGGNITSIEDVNIKIAELQNRQNDGALAEFHGLSPRQMYRFLYFPFESEEFVVFPDTLESPQVTSRAAFLITSLLNGIGEGGLKLTVKGNLPRKFIQEIAQTYYQQWPARFEPLSIRTETDFLPLHVGHLVVQLAGFIRKQKGKIFLTAKASKAMATGGIKVIYPQIFKAYIEKFAWSYQDGHDELPFLQSTFLFTLYLLHRYGQEWRPHSFYEDAVVRAFPMLMDEIVLRPWHDNPEEPLRRCYSLRMLERFAGFFGLVDLEETSQDPLRAEWRVRATPLLSELVRFSV